MTTPTSPNSDKSKRLRISGLALSLAWDSETEQFTGERLNEQVAALQSIEASSVDAGAPKNNYDVLSALKRLDDHIVTLTDIVYLQHASLLAMVANTGHENEKALALMVQATDDLLAARTPIEATKERPLSDLLDKLRQKEFEEQRGLESQSHTELDQSQRPQGREMN